MDEKQQSPDQPSKPETALPLVDVPGLAHAIGVKPSKIYQLTRQKGVNTIPAFRIGKHLRFSIPEVLEWFRAEGRGV